MAPEVYKGWERGYNPEKAMVFSLGVILFILMFRKYPFAKSTEDDESYQYVIDDDFSSFFNKHGLSREHDYEAAKLVWRCISFYP